MSTPQDDIDTLQLLSVRYLPAQAGLLQTPQPPSRTMREDLLKVLFTSERLTHYLMDRIGTLEAELRGAKLTMAALTKQAGGDLSVSHAEVEALQTAVPWMRGEFSVKDEETPEGLVKRLRWREPEGQDAVEGSSTP